MEDAINRLSRAIDFAILQTVSGSADQQGALYSRLVCALTTQGRVNDAAGVTQLPNYEAFRDVLPLVVQDADGRKSLHDVWNSPQFIAPAIACLAIVYDRTTHPYGDSFLSLTVSENPAALYGYRLEGLTAEAFDYSATGVKTVRPMGPKDWTRVTISLAGAALSFAKDLSIMRFAPFYLDTIIRGTVPEGAEAPAPRGRTPFIKLVAGGAH